MVELLPDGRALAAWLAAAGLVPRSRSVRLKRCWSAARFAAAVEDLRNFRERLRKAVCRVENGGSLAPVFLRELNRLLASNPYLDHIVSAPSGLERRKSFAPQTPAQVFAPLADSAASLFTGLPRTRLRKCPGCVLHFYDTSRKGTRTWCSMNMCGNRAKVATYAARQRAAARLRDRLTRRPAR